MLIFADHFYEKGHSHLVCQDYALSQIEKDYAFFVVSDGCGSAQNSEIGSMILAQAFKSAYNLIWHENIDINKPYGSMFIHEKTMPYYAQKITDLVLSKTKEISRSLELLPESLYATLLFGSYEKKSKQFSLWAHGDGIFVILLKDGSYKIVEMEYENNAPYYMAYLSGEGTLESYIKNCGGDNTVTTYHYDGNGTRLSKTEMFRNFPSPYSLKPDDSIVGILGFSDGVQSFKEHFTSVIPKCIDFKNINGTFIERRLRRLIKQKAKEGDLPYDDFSCAGIYVK